MLIRLSIVVLMAGAPVYAQAPVTLTETLPAGRCYTVESSVDLHGTLMPPVDKGRAAPPLTMSGHSAIAYGERLLAPLADGAERSVRIYRQAEFVRSINDKSFEAGIRAAVRRMVLIRRGSREVPFSPDGPLTFGEIDIVHYDVFTPALAGFLPVRPVSIGDRWQAAKSAVEELTDIGRIEQGGLECRLSAIDGRVAHVAFSGTVRGVNDDGPVAQQLQGNVRFDIAERLITGLDLTASKTLLDGQGRPTGKIEGRLTLTRRAADIAAFADAKLAGLTLEPNASNSLLLYEGAAVNARFTYPRRWRVSAEDGRRITIDEPHGNGILITVEPSDKVPSSAEYIRENNDYIVKHKGKVLRMEPPVGLRPFPSAVERFGMDIELEGKPARMEYAVIRQNSGGATLAARLLPADAGALKSDIDHIAKSMQIGPAAVPGVVPLLMKP